MSQRPAVLLASIALLFGLVLAGSAQAGPLVQSVTPQLGAAAGGTLITIVGSGFISALGSPPVVHVGRSLASFDAPGCSMSPTELVCAMPRARNFALEALTVEVDGKSSASVPAGYHPPAVLGVSSSTSAHSGGVPITIHGSDFSCNFPRVSFGGLGERRPLSASDTELVVDTPPGTQASTPIMVVCREESASAGTLTYAGPRVLSVTPQTVQARGGVRLTINGSSFSATGSRVLLDGRECRMIGSSDTQIECDTPPLAYAGASARLQVRAGGLRSNLVTLSKDRAPVIDRVLPPTAAMVGGVRLTVRGANFDGVTSVSFGGVSVTPALVSSRSLEVDCPSSPVSGPVSLSVSDGSSSSSAIEFHYLAPPQIGSLSASSVPSTGGRIVTITGSGFGPYAGAATITVKGNGNALPVRWSAPEVLRFTAPPGVAGPVDLSVTVSGVETLLPAAFSYDNSPPLDAPVIDSITPSHARAVGGAVITLHGSNFTGSGADATIHLSARPDAKVTVNITSNQIACILPPGTPGDSVTIEVERDGMGSAQTPFAYDPPQIDAVSPPSGARRGGSIITLVGRDFVDPVARCEGAEVAVVHATPETVLVIAPASVDLDTVKFTLQSGFIYAVHSSLVLSPPAPFVYEGPKLTSFSATSVPARGGVPITVVGQGFDAGSGGGGGGGGGAGGFLTARFGDSQGSVTSLTDTEVFVDVPANPAGPVVFVSMEVNGVESNALPLVYRGPTISTVSPPAGRASGGTPITIFGADFSDLTTVRAAGQTVFHADGDADRIRCVTPPGIGMQVVELLQDDASSSVPFEFLAPPTVASVLPSHGVLAGGTVITIVGEHFGPAGTSVARSVSIGGVECVDASVGDDGALHCTTGPAPAEGAADVVVTIDEVSATQTAGFTYSDVLDAGGIALPQRFALSAAWPDPSRGTTRLRLALPAGGRYTIDIVDVTGHRVRRFDGDAAAGTVDLAWDGRSSTGAQVAPGLYFARATAGSQSASRRMVRVE